MGAIDYDADIRTGADDDPNKGGGYRREPYMSLQSENDFVIIRPLAEANAWRIALTHRFVPVQKGAPEGHEGKWPEMMSATCRKDQNLAKYYPQGCAICAMPGQTKYGKTWEKATEPLRYMLAVEREMVKAADGSIVIQDKTVDVPVFDDQGNETKETTTVPSLLIVNATMYQFFSNLKALWESYGSITNRDFRVTKIKNPSGKGTLLQVIALDSTPDIRPGSEHWEMYEIAQQLWVPGGLRLPQLIGEKSEDSHYERFWTTNGVVLPKGSVPTVAATAAPTASPVASEDRLAAMRARALGQKQTPEAAPADAVPAS